MLWYYVICQSKIVQNRSYIFRRRPVLNLKLYYGHAWLVHKLLKTRSPQPTLLPPTHEILYTAYSGFEVPATALQATGKKESKNNNSNIHEQAEMISLNLFHSIGNLTCETYPLKLVLYNNLHYASASTVLLPVMHFPTLLCWEPSKHLIALGLKPRADKVMTTCSLSVNF